jgi:hypothetical protein
VHVQHRLHEAPELGSFAVDPSDQRDRQVRRHVLTDDVWRAGHGARDLQETAQRDRSLERQRDMVVVECQVVAEQAGAGCRRPRPSVAGLASRQSADPHAGRVAGALPHGPQAVQVQHRVDEAAELGSRAIDPPDQRDRT